jgi:hypothetical protein
VHTRLRTNAGAGTDGDVLDDPDLPAEDRTVADGDAPESPVCAAMITPRPMRQLCATCTWSSSFEPAPIIVSPRTARSIVDNAPISTSSSIRTRPTCGIFATPSAVGW